jgi:ribosome-binding protein aMBF1 (putative translation factor)
MSEETVSPAQIRAGRALLGWSPADLAEHSGASEAEIAHLEAQGAEAQAGAALVAALEKAGVLFLAEDDGEGAGVRLSRPRSAPREITLEELNASNDE